MNAWSADHTSTTCDTNDEIYKGEHECTCTRRHRCKRGRERGGGGGLAHDSVFDNGSGYATLSTFMVSTPVEARRTCMDGCSPANPFRDISLREPKTASDLKNS